jgi:tetratricopeptide (TPR) repeat protein
MGRASEGLDYLNYAIRLSPRDPILSYWLSYVGEAEFELNHDERAIDSFQRALALNPGHPPSLAGLAAAHALADNLDEAHAQLAELQRVVPHTTREKLFARFGGGKATEKLRRTEGLRLAIATQM